MTHQQFRRLQRIMDDLGLITFINKVGRNAGRRYEVVINHQLEKKYKRRISAKRFIIGEFIEKLKTI